jgi:heterotetrameric sarcosine oxidase delta subunit
MASLIHCPHCGARPKEEFSIKGAALTRPTPESSEEAWFDYVFQRQNPRGVHDEYWHHTSGCRRWLVVSRDTVSHETVSVRDVSEARRAQQ